MCGRYNIISDLHAWLLGWGLARDLLEESDWQASYNITPSSWVPIIRAASGGDALVIDKARWGFVPHWVKEEKPKLQPANARSDKIAVSRYFRDSFRHRRCLFPASGFYEWHTEQNAKQPFNIVHEDGSPLLMAGIWDNWNGDDTAAIITTDANEAMAPIHDRMPVIITPEAAKDWILGQEPQRFLHSTDKPLRTYKVSKAVSNPRNNGPDLVKPIGGEE